MMKLFVEKYRNLLDLPELFYSTSLVTILWISKTPDFNVHGKPRIGINPLSSEDKIYLIRFSSGTDKMKIEKTASLNKLEPILADFLKKMNEE